MDNQLDKIKEDFATKILKLEFAKTQLKKEFFGIDKVIDELIENVRSWYTMSSIQEKPIVINLWGLTGVGKTALVQRLLALIDCQDKAYRFDLGNKNGSMAFPSVIGDLGANREDTSIAIILDEFQHSRTVRGPHREEIKEDNNRVIWELIDSGVLNYHDCNRMWRIEDTTYKLLDLIRGGVEVEKGIIVKKREIYLKEMFHVFETDEGPILFVPEDDYESIIDVAGEALEIPFIRDLENLLLSLNGQETIEFLKRVIRIGTRPKKKSFTKSIIFTLGNIDEAYTMSGDYNVDVSADEFHEQSLKISILDMKKALRARFRDEQIARLGTIHIIYPSLSSTAYRSIIMKELALLSEKMKTEFGIQISFDSSLVDEVYKEGVYPTQGVRPLFTAIHQLVKSKLSIFVNEILTRELDITRLKVTVNDGQLRCEFHDDLKLIHTQCIPIVSKLKKLKQSKKDELQAVTAVHEAGHAVISISLLQSVPEFILSVTSDSETSGMVYSKSTNRITAKKDMHSKTAFQLAGLVAEELVFGEDYLTVGASSDIHAATSMLTSLFKDNGFGEVPIAYSLSKTEAAMAYHCLDEVEENIKQVVISAKQLARTTLIKEKKLLLAIAQKLSTVSRIEKEELLELISKNSTIRIPDSNSLRFYRDTLLSQFESSNSKSGDEHRNLVLLNKNNDVNGKQQQI